MLPTVFVAAFAGFTLPEGLVDQLVSKRVVVAERLVRVDLAIRTGDPLGSRAEGTLKTLSEPALMVRHKKTGAVRAGGRVAVPGADGKIVMEPVGVGVEVTPVLRLDGKIQLDMLITETEVNPDRGLNTKSGFVPGIDSRSIRHSTVVPQGERFKVRVSSRSDKDQTWVEVGAKVCEPTGTPAK